MSSSLPRRPSVEHLKKQAKMLLAAQRAGRPAVCRVLRKIRRFAAASDREILAARVTLVEAQLALALQYGCASWQDLTTQARSHPRSSRDLLAEVAGLDALR